MIIKLISIYLLIGVMFLSYMFVNSFLKGRSSYAKMLGALSLVLQFYLLGYLMELNSDTLKQMLFWNQVQYFGIPFFPALWLAVSMVYTGRGKYLKGMRGAIVFLIPSLTFVFRLTNSWHHLYYSQIGVQLVGEAKLMLLTKGPWYLVQAGYALTALVLCTWVYYKRYKNSNYDERMQFRLLLAASGFPYIALVLVTLNIGGIGIDYTALILPPCIFLMNLALTQYNFLEIKALAREKVFEDSALGLILLNRFFRVVDYNDASILFFKWFGVQIREVELDVLLKEKPEVLEGIRGEGDKIIHISNEGKERVISIKSKNMRHKEEALGLLITFEDVTERELLKRQLIELANTDTLSGLYNRRKFRETAEEAYQRAVRYEEPLAVLMMDIDYFKRVNDNYGHFIGDAVIRSFSGILAEVFRETDIVGRMGGEEFAVVMLNSNGEQAFNKAEEFRKLIEKESMRFEELQVSITISIGVAERKEDMTNFDILLNRADQSLYEAKNLKRNCTILG